MKSSESVHSSFFLSEKYFFFGRSINIIRISNTSFDKFFFISPLNGQIKSPAKSDMSKRLDMSISPVRFYYLPSMLVVNLVKISWILTVSRNPLQRVVYHALPSAYMARAALEPYGNWVVSTEWNPGEIALIQHDMLG